MENQIRFSLLVAAALYMGWGMSLLLAPQAAHVLISDGPNDSVTTAMFGAVLIGMMVMFLIAAYDPEREIVRAAVVGLAVVGFASAYLIFIAKTMPLAPVTVISMLIDLGACAALFLGESRLDVRGAEGDAKVAVGRRRTSVDRRRHA